MSTDPFAPAVFPRLIGSADGSERERARVRGYAEGHAEGFRAASAEVTETHRRAEESRRAQDAAAARELDAAVAALHAAAASFATRERELTTATESRVVDAAIELAEIILAAELTDAGASAAAAVRRALAEVDAAAMRELRVHPDDLRTLTRHDGAPNGVALIADPELERGDALVVLEDGHIDARIAAGLHRARRALSEDST